MSANVRMPISAGKKFPLGIVILIFLALVAVTARAQSTKSLLASSDLSPAKSPDSDETTNVYVWSSVASTEAGLARYHLKIPGAINNSDDPNRLIVGFRSIQLRAFEKPKVELPVDSGIALEVRQSDYSDLLSFRLGPYFERLLSERLLLHASGGLAIGLLDASAGWNGTPLLAGNSLTSRSTYFEVFRGLYAGVDVIYHFSKKWAVDVGAQIQNFGPPDRNVSQLPSSLSWSKCIFVQTGFKYSF